MKILNNSKIKKYISAILALAVLTAVFSSCGATGGGGQYSENDVSPQFRNDYATDVDFSKSRLVYDMLTDPCEGIQTSLQPFDTNEYYFTMQKDNGTKYGATFTATINADNQQTVLCAKDGCAHIDDTCPAYIDLFGGYFTVNGRLYFYSPYAYPESTDMLNGTGNRIRVFSIDHNGKQVFAEITGFSQQDGTVITDGANLYLTAKNEKDMDIYIIRVDLSTGASEVLYKLPPRYGLMEYRITAITANSRQLIISARDFNKPEDYSVGVYSFADNEFQIIKKLPEAEYTISTEKGNVKNYIIIGNYLYEFDMNTGDITKQQLGKDERQTVISDAKQLTDGAHHITFSHAYGNKVVLNCFAGEKHRLSTAEYYVLDTDTHAITPLDIKAYNSMGVMCLVRIFSVTPDYFVIATDRSQHNAMANHMAIISKDNFYTNNYLATPIGIIGH